MQTAFASIGLKSTASSTSEHRIALVIGNSHYQDTPLENPANDARDIANTLRKLNFKVIELIDADIKAMDKAINTFGQTLEKKKGVGLFYYAGHGVQSKGRNYLIPVSAQISRETDLKYEAIDAGKIFDEMGYAENRLNIVILDASHHTLLNKNFKQPQHGLAKPSDLPGYLFLTYSTSPGAVSSDIPGRSSPYTEYLISAMNKPDLPLNTFFNEVIKNVTKATKGQQVPWINASIDADFYFSSQKNKKSDSQTTTENANYSENNVIKFELLYWESVTKNPTKEKYQSYLNKYPKGHFTDIAKSEISRLDNTIPKQTSLKSKNSISKQLKKCEQFLKSYKLSTNKNGNAYECYNRILSKEPGNKSAINGLTKVEDSYVKLIQTAARKGQQAKSKKYLSRLEFLNSNHSEISELKVLIAGIKPPLKPKKKFAVEKNAKPVKLSEEQQQIFNEYIEIIEEFLSEKNLNAKQRKKMNRYITKLESINPGDKHLIELKKKIYRTVNHQTQPQLVSISLSEDEQQIFDEFLEVVNEMMQEDRLSKTQKNKLEKYFKKLEKINPTAQELIEAKRQYQLK